MQDRLLQLEDIRNAQNPEKIAVLFRKLGYNASAEPLAVEELELPSRSAEAAVDAYVIAREEKSDLWVWLFQLQPKEFSSESVAKSRMKAIAENLCKNRICHFLLLGTKDYKQLLLVKPQKDESTLKVRVNFWYIDLTEPTLDDGHLLEKIAAFSQTNKRDLHQIQCEAFGGLKQKKKKKLKSEPEDELELGRKMVRLQELEAVFDPTYNMGELKTMNHNSEQLKEQLQALKDHFLEVQNNFLEAAEPLGISPGQQGGEMVDFSPLESLLSSIEKAEEELSRATEIRQQALTVLERVLAIFHRDNSDFQPLLECQKTARELQRQVSESVGVEVDSEIQALAEGNHPYSELLGLILERESQDYQRLMQLQAAVNEFFDPPLAMAALTGNLVFSEEPKDTEKEPPEKLEQSPLTVKGEPELANNPKRVFILCVSESSRYHLRHNLKFKKLELGDRLSHYLDDLSTKDDLPERLKKLTCRRPEGTTEIYICDSCSWGDDWIDEAIEEVNKLRSLERPVQIFFIADPKKTWQLVSCNSLDWSKERMVNFEPGFDLIWEPLVKKHHFPSDRTTREKISAVTGNWLVLLAELFHICESENLGWEEALEELNQRLNSSNFAKILAYFMGFNPFRPQQQQVLKNLAILEEASAEDLIDKDLIDVVENITPGIVSRTLRWAELLNFVTPVGEKDDGKNYWRIDPVVERILQAIDN